MKPKLRSILSLILLLCLIVFSGCSDDPLVRHKLKTDFFDGVPELPPLAQLCEDNMDDIFNTYYQNRLAEASAGSIEEKRLSQPDQVIPRLLTKTAGDVITLKKPTSSLHQRINFVKYVTSIL